MEEYLIFSDESGSWASQNGNNNPPFYVRSWVKIKRKECEKIDFRFNIDNILGQNKIEVLFTFTLLEEFYTRKFRAREENVAYVENAINTLERQFPREYLLKIPDKVRHSIDYVLFLYIYEKWHIENALERLWDPNNKYTFIFEKPQFNLKDYKKVISSTNIAGNYKIVPAKSHIELKIADMLARFFNRKIMEKLWKGEVIEQNILKYYKQYILPNLTKNSNMRGSCGTGVNKVFLNRFITKKEIKLIQDLNRLNVLRPKEIIKRPYYLESPMVWSETRGKWYVINETGNWLEFIGKEEDIEWRIVK